MLTGLNRRTGSLNELTRQSELAPNRLYLPLQQLQEAGCVTAVHLGVVELEGNRKCYSTKACTAAEASGQPVARTAEGAA